MSGLIPKQTTQVMRSFNDLGVRLYGIECTLFVPINLTTLEPNDMYTDPTTITYRQYNQIPVWLEWFAAGKDLHRLRKLGVFAEGESPIIARFMNTPEVIMNSYIKLESNYMPDNYDTDSLEVVDVLMPNMYDIEIYRYFKMAPFRKKTT